VGWDVIPFAKRKEELKMSPAFFLLSHVLITGSKFLFDCICFYLSRIERDIYLVVPLTSMKA